MLEIRAAARRPLLLFLCVVAPYLLLGLLGYGIAGFLNGENEPIKVAIVDGDQTFETKSLINQLQEDETLNDQLRFIPEEIDEVEKGLRNGEWTGAVIIPAGFTADLRSGTNTPMEVWLNDTKPLESGVVQLLLDSAASYISAAQSGVNAVYQSVIQPMENSEERQQLLQQVIITFTLEALDRNGLFVTENIERGASIGWVNHAAIGAWMLGSWLSLSLFIASRQSLLHGGVRDRLQTMNIGKGRIYLVHAALFFLFILIGNEMFFFVYGFYVQEALQPSQLLLLFHALLQAGLAAFFLAVTRRKVEAALWYGILSLPLLLASGVLIPRSYLPQWLNNVQDVLPWHRIYQGLQETSLFFLLVPSGWGLALVFTCWLIIRKVEKRNGYPA
nr:ABC transporter permease [Thalassobacillus devorans]